jgi:hypothetical protein
MRTLILLLFASAVVASVLGDQEKIKAAFGHLGHHGGFKGFTGYPGGHLAGFAGLHNYGGFGGKSGPYFHQPGYAPYGLYSYLAYQNNRHKGYGGGYGGHHYGGHHYGGGYGGSSHGSYGGSYHEDSYNSDYKDDTYGTTHDDKKEHKGSSSHNGGSYESGSSYDYHGGGGSSSSYGGGYRPGYHGGHGGYGGPHLAFTKDKIDDHLAKLYKLGNRRLSVQVDYANTPLEYLYLQKYHKFPHPLKGTALGKAVGIGRQHYKHPEAPYGSYPHEKGYLAHDYVAPNQGGGYKAPNLYGGQTYEQTLPGFQQQQPQQPQPNTRYGTSPPQFNNAGQEQPQQQPQQPEYFQPQPIPGYEQQQPKQNQGPVHQPGYATPHQNTAGFVAQPDQNSGYFQQQQQQQHYHQHQNNQPDHNSGYMKAHPPHYPGYPQPDHHLDSGYAQPSPNPGFSGGKAGPATHVHVHEPSYVPQADAYEKTSAFGGSGAADVVTPDNSFSSGTGVGDNTYVQPIEEEFAGQSVTGGEYLGGGGSTAQRHQVDNNGYLNPH